VIHSADLALFGPFQGHDRDLDTCEALLFQLWPDKERKREVELFQSKWFDYRTLHAAHATYLFSHIFTTEIRAIMRAHFNDAPARVSATGKVLDWNPIKAGDVFEAPAAARNVGYWKRKVIGLIRARQQADADGIPYEVFIGAALKHFYFGAGTYVLQRADQGGGRTLMVAPNLLYGDDCLAAIRAAWLGDIGMRVQAAKHPRYKVVNDDGHPDHAEHRDWLRQQLEHRGVQDWAAARLVTSGLLTRPQALDMVRDPAALQSRLGVISVHLGVAKVSHQ